MHSSLVLFCYRLLVNRCALHVHCISVFFFFSLKKKQPIYIYIYVCVCVCVCDIYIQRDNLRDMSKYNLCIYLYFYIDRYLLVWPPTFLKIMKISSDSHWTYKVMICGCVQNFRSLYWKLFVRDIANWNLPDLAFCGQIEGETFF